MKNNLLLGLLGGLVAALAGAVAWAYVTVATGYQIGWMAVGIGFIVGFAIRFMGKGNTATFGIMGAVLALLGCLAGNLFTIFGYAAQESGISAIQIAQQFDYSMTFEIMKSIFSPMDLLFYGIAVYEGFRFSWIPESTFEQTSNLDPEEEPLS